MSPLSPTARLLHRALRSTLCAAVASIAAVALMAAPAQAHSEASAALSLLPMASVVGAVVVVPAALSSTGALLTVSAVQVSAVGTVYLLARASDGAEASVEVLGRGAQASAYGVGSVVTCSVLGTGVLLSVAGEVLAFIPNAIGQALLHNERL